MIQVSVSGKETEGKKRRRDERDRISELPDCILMHIMSFLDTKDAVQTCILSKRWKDLCKCLTDLTFRSPFRCKCKKYFRKFVSWVLSSRNDSCSLLNVDINNSWIEKSGVYKMSIQIESYYYFESEKQALPNQFIKLQC